jgi:LytS/YehU family sensor histidine kinase
VLDKFGVRSKQTARIQIHIKPAFYQTFWFWGLVFFVTLAIGFYIIRSRFAKQRALDQKEQKLNNKIIELEQQALKAQMNPHFIFNCLTAIQHFVNREDVYSANIYLSNFAKLIRKTLDLSGESSISLDKEIAYLANYIQLEKMRFQDKFDYSITADEDIDTQVAQVPPMLIQPIVENAIRHGLRYKEDNTGMLIISFKMDNNELVCTIDDNGIGMTRSRELKKGVSVEYQSKGRTLTQDRINALNMINEKKIRMHTEEKHAADGTVNGTMVTIIFEQ